MSAKILDGKLLAQHLREGLKAEVDALKEKTGKTPRFMNIVVGKDPGAASYAKSQIRVAEAVGVSYEFVCFQQHVSEEEMLDQITLLNNDPSVHGVMVHKPLPDSLSFQKLIDHIVPEKDIEGMNEANLGRLFLGKMKIVPCTPAGAMALLMSSGVDIAGKNAVIVGRSEIVGKPMMFLLLKKDATVTVCHSVTSKAGFLEECVGRADVLVVAMGRAGFIKGKWVKEGAIVIDVGINSVDGKITGDVEFDEALKRAAYITPVPGGVGPVTAVMLMKNGIEAFKQQLKK